MRIEPTPDQTLGSLLRGELAAVESYGEAIRYYPELAAHPLLEGVRADHGRAVEALKDLIIAGGGHPPMKGELWDLHVTGEKSTHLLPSQAPALSAFKHGEKATVAQYQCALEGAGLPISAQAVIRDVLLPLAWKNWFCIETMVT